MFAQMPTGNQWGTLLQSLGGTASQIISALKPPPAPTTIYQVPPAPAAPAKAGMGDMTMWIVLGVGAVAIFMLMPQLKEGRRRR